MFKWPKNTVCPIDNPLVNSMLYSLLIGLEIRIYYELLFAGSESVSNQMHAPIWIHSWWCWYKLQSRVLIVIVYRLMLKSILWIASQSQREKLQLPLFNFRSDCTIFFGWAHFRNNSTNHQIMMRGLKSNAILLQLPLQKLSFESAHWLILRSLETRLSYLQYTSEFNSLILWLNRW